MKAFTTQSFFLTMLLLSLTVASRLSSGLGSEFDNSSLRRKNLEGHDSRIFGLVLNSICINNRIGKILSTLMKLGIKIKLWWNF